MENVNVASEAYQVKASSLIRRLVSLVFPLPLILVVVYLGVWSVALFVVLSISICLFELYTALQQYGYRPRMSVGFLSAGLLWAAALFQPSVHVSLLPMVLATSILLALMAEFPQPIDEEHSLASWALSLAGSYYVGGLLSFFVMLSQLTTPLRQSWLGFLHISPGSAWIYFVLSVVWLQDTGAYFVGRSFGKHKMSPIISPKKTWEGAIGGIVTAVIVALFTVPLLGLPINFLVAALLGLIGGCVGLIGDLVESLIKRRIGVKDMGNIMPGHGGLLDRADSIIFAAPIMYYLILLFT
jgi:phosphatidate cytidylyltransferase